jgi:hypothetical protein
MDECVENEACVHFVVSEIIVLYQIPCGILQIHAIIIIPKRIISYSDVKGGFKEQTDIDIIRDRVPIDHVV